METAVKPSEYSIEGCIEMFGAHIRTCIEDYAQVHRHVSALEKTLKRFDGTHTPKTIFQHGRLARIKHILHNYRTAKNYLFGNGLQSDIIRLELPINIDYIRAKAEKQAKTAVFNRSNIVED